MTDLTEGHRETNLTLALSDEIAGEIAGLGSVVQGAVVADLTARWLVGHPPGFRAEAWDMFTKLVLDLVPINEKLIFDGAGHPACRAEQS